MNRSILADPSWLATILAYKLIWGIVKHPGHFSDEVCSKRERMRQLLLGLDSPVHGDSTSKSAMNVDGLKHLLTSTLLTNEVKGTVMFVDVNHQGTSHWVICKPEFEECTVHYYDIHQSQDVEARVRESLPGKWSLKSAQLVRMPLLDWSLLLERSYSCSTAAGLWRSCMDE